VLQARKRNANLSVEHFGADRCGAHAGAEDHMRLRDSPLRSQSFLVFGKSGWIGGLLGDLLKAQGAKFEYANCRLEDRAAIISEIDRVSLEGRGGRLSPASA
jgi:hypothetical protein